MLTIIPDLHADQNRLKASLKRADQTVAFLGDFIDGSDATGGGNSDAAVLKQVRTLFDKGRAVGVMGNHELNAILFHRRGEDGQPLRPHSPKNIDQHRSFLSCFGTETREAIEWTEWFRTTLPLWRDESGLRLVHAFWSDTLINVVKLRRPDGLLHPEDLPEIADESTEFGRAVKLLVSGPEVLLPEGYWFADMKGNKRREVRVAWWRGAASSWADIALSVPDHSILPREAFNADLAALMYPPEAASVLVGHYKMAGPVQLDHAYAACLDYPATPCVYHFGGERSLLETNVEVLN